MYYLESWFKRQRSKSLNTKLNIKVLERTEDKKFFKGIKRLYSLPKYSIQKPTDVP